MNAIRFLKVLLLVLFLSPVYQASALDRVLMYKLVGSAALSPLPLGFAGYCQTKINAAEKLLEEKIIRRVARR